MKCQCEDSSGVVCGKEMTKEEYKQDGMCWDCADHVWNEMTSTEPYKWHHPNMSPEGTKLTNRR